MFRTCYAEIGMGLILVSRFQAPSTSSDGSWRNREGGLPGLPGSNDPSRRFVRNGMCISLSMGAGNLVSKVVKE